jgi:hypothetical protein
LVFTWSNWSDAFFSDFSSLLILNSSTRHLSARHCQDIQENTNICCRNTANVGFSKLIPRYKQTSIITAWQCTTRHNRLVNMLCLISQQVAFIFEAIKVCTPRLAGKTSKYS